MKIRYRRCIHRLRHRCFLFSVSLVAVCLVYIKVRVKDSIFMHPYGITFSLSGLHSHQYDVNCSAIYELDPVEIGKALKMKQKVIVDVDDYSTVSLTSDCQTFVKTRMYDGIPVSEVEHSFPLAYSLVVHKNAPMVERILHAIYAPQNIYCLHYDQKSTRAFIAAMKNLAQCLPNVFIASKLESVEYAHISRLHADLNCLFDLLRSQVKWEYVINLCGQDFPLKSNAELVGELRQLKGRNMLESSQPSEVKKQRFSFKHELRNVPYEYRRIPVKTTVAKDAPPHAIMMFTGSAYFVLSWDFVNYISSNQVVKDFLAWSADTYSPDEHFWATLVRLPGVPGHISRSEPDVSDLKSKTRLVKWNYLEGALYPPCTGTHMRSVCIYGTAELHWLLSDGHWFANKFDPKVDPILIQCLEEKLMEKRYATQK
ncbi:beta-1,3-galactosyl-O-glycosyl-glycoprotein beta-1,6-N-acetylglucosaminyltransferase 4-like [Dunckerocampus dactyliophorus]|uniref:beta-1,3-galactosyl-O-glycosyl-glycoprotein beta-1,6-N-acetylglucosaminyltransferase 4-like n=1 Tax=Dunckerocampus dactyliophorus TaxID=161453 RepID=UPI0024077194|nr:beta-1,3-galactosyl-O-glycosyl-glycoprotein beta-1,6-N-acetylglucosaminyltransferase 4-like [Dunckerocampus dactyliophorus]XP_054630991.1 beta-1,3-galactosyl-O-glycosyl-glycoprotein beta-1,6-N-acetylglucosaminyltransferase 4-like [Dunckerocampus dactyliophorus]